MAVNRTTPGPAGTPRSRQTSTVLAWILPHLLAHVAECGYDATPLRRLPGLAGRDLDDPDVRVADASAAEAWHLAEQITGDDAIGLHMAQSIPAGALDILEYAFRSSPTVGSGLDQLARYVRAVSDRAAAELDIVGDALAFTWVKPAQPHRVEFAFALIVRMAREATGTSLAPREVHFAHRPPESRLEHRAFFRSPVRFGEVFESPPVLSNGPGASAAKRRSGTLEDRAPPSGQDAEADSPEGLDRNAGPARVA